ncbi:hypothetical protein MKW98_017083 [Papaver atlanticum]|uniref:Histone-lysine N-methyltransferase ASHH2 n=1 Tax=Papaver atlanticum TaxID=357466 RepID=A0AAD4TH56_9MAGN|nr:hypothetical protein MKW98_017083 [Papaver atlanticum]
MGCNGPCDMDDEPLSGLSSVSNCLFRVETTAPEEVGNVSKGCESDIVEHLSERVTESLDLDYDDSGDGDDMGFGQGMCSEEACLISNSFLDIEDRPAVFLSPECSNAVTNLNSSAVQDVVSVSRDGQENRSWNNDLYLSVKILQDEACVSELCPEESSQVGQLCCSVGTQESLMGTKEFQHEGGIISTAQDKELCFLKSPLNTSPSKCTQQFEQEDPKMFVPSGESEEKHYILPGSSIALTTQVSHTEEDNFESPQSNHTQQTEYKDDEIFIPSDEADKVREENVEERHNALPESNEMTRLPDTQENNSCNLIEGPPNMASECAIEDSASLLLSQHLGVVSISSFNCSVTQNHQEIDSLADASACSLIDSTVQTFNEIKDTVEADFASTSTFTDIVHLSPRIRTQQSKSSDMIPRRKTARLRTLVNSIVPAKPIAISSEISRGKRSCPSKQARSSIWGTLGHIMDVFTERDGLVKREPEPEPQFNQMEKQRSNKRNNGQGGKRRKNSRAGGNSRTPRKTKSCVTTGRIRLKVKIEEEDRGQTSPNIVPPDVIESLESVPILAGEISSKPVFSGEISELVNDVECKMAEIVHDTGADLENLVTFQGSSIQEFLHHGDKYTAENVHDTTFTTCRADLENSVTFRGASVESTGAHDISVRSTLSDCPWVSSQNKMETLVEAVDCRYTDPGTSPDSEVINLVQEDTAGTRESVLHDSVCIEGCPGGSSIVSGPDELGERFKVETVLQSFETSGRLFPTSKPVGLKIPKCPKSSSGLSKRRSRAPDSARRADGSTPPKQKGDSRKSVNKGKSKKEDTLALAMSKGEIQQETDEGACMFPKMGNHSELHGLPELNSSNIVGSPSDAQEKPKNDNKVAPEGFSESSVSNAFDQQLLPSRNAWVLCDDCHKWRCIPAALADSIEETNCQWTCKENMDKAFADCSIPQEKTNAEINAELDISDASGEEDVCNAQSNRKGVEAKKISDSKPASWTLIKTNSFLHRKRKTQVIDEIMVCHCKPPQDGQLGCGDECLNRLLNIECVHGTCPCGDLCSNQQFQKRKYAKFQWFRCGKKGFGLQLQQNVPEGAFLIEYVGEVLDLHSYEVRQKEYASRGQKHFYFMTLNGSEVIDACGKGNLGRFINHSCDPNCRTEKWMVNGEVCVGLFALRDLKKGEEVTFDYNYVRVFGAAAKRCKCGSSVCRGYIGGDPSNTEVVVQGDSDEEYPEPSMVTEDSYYADFVDENSDSSLADGAIVEHGECTVNASDTVCTSFIKQVEQSPEKGSVSVSSFEPLVSMTAEGTARESPSHGPGVLLQTQDTMFKSSSGFPSLQTQDATSSAPITQPLETSVTTKLISKSLSDSDPANKKYISESLEEKSNISKPQPVLKSSRPSVSVKKVKSNSSAVTSSKARVVANKPKKLLEATSNNCLEGVEDKLNELLDSDGGISKRKDATKGYLKLLLVTAASGDNVNGEAVQSTRDLSIILDALLKTKSRMVLADIISKNGLQMLHNVLKHNRRNFNKTPIIRKLLKALEDLAVKKILTIEQINRVPPRAEIESFRESILELTRHSDVQVHQIARNFRDTWIPRPTRRYGYSNRENGNLELHNGSSFNRTSVSRKRWHDNDGIKPMEDVNSHLHIGSSDPATDGYRNNGANIRKRKSRWDQPEVNAKVPERTEVDENLKGKQKMELNAHHTDMELAGERNISNGCYQSNLSQGDLVQEIHDDAPPGFPAPFSSSPTLVSHTSSSTASPSSLLRDTNTDCGGYCELVTGCIQGRYMSHLTVSYGIPLSFVEQLGTTEAGVLDSWVTAPSIPFHPFPPLPRFPRDESNSLTSPSSTMKHNEGGCKEEVLREGNWHQEDINMTSTSGRARPPEGSATWGRGNNCKRMVDEPMRYSSAGSGNLGQRYFRQRKWNSNRRNGPPWSSRRNNGMGWKESGNNSPRNGVQNIDLGNVENLHGDRGESENKNNASTVFQERPQYGYE